MPEGGEDAQRRERRLGVVAQELRIAEEESGFCIVVGVPRGQRENATREPCGFAEQPCAHHSAAPESCDKVDRDKGERNRDRGFLGKRGGGEPQRGGPGFAAATGERVVQSPQRAGGGKDVGLGQRALREPDGVEAREQHGPEGDGGRAHQAHGQPPHPEQRERGHQQHGLARDFGIEAGGLPAEREVDARERRVGVGESGCGDQRAGAEEVPCRGNVVAGLVPVVGQAQQREMGQIERHEDDREDHPERQRPIQPRIEDCSQAQRLAPSKAASSF